MAVTKCKPRQLAQATRQQLVAATQALLDNSLINEKTYATIYNESLSIDELGMVCHWIKGSLSGDHAQKRTGDRSFIIDD